MDDTVAAAGAARAVTHEAGQARDQRDPSDQSDQQNTQSEWQRHAPHISDDSRSDGRGDGHDERTRQDPDPTEPLDDADDPQEGESFEAPTTAESPNEGVEEMPLIANPGSALPALHHEPGGSDAAPAAPIVQELATLLRQAVAALARPTLLPTDLSDDQVIALWLARRPASTVETYARDIRLFRAFLADHDDHADSATQARHAQQHYINTGDSTNPEEIGDTSAPSSPPAPSVSSVSSAPPPAIRLHDVTYAELVAYVESLGHLGDASIRRRLSAVKSLYSFLLATGYLNVNPCAALRLHRASRELASRLLSQEEVQRMLALTTTPRDHALLRLLYNAGLRVSEICALRWRHVLPREGGRAQLVVRGKGNQVRYVLISAQTYLELHRLAPTTSMASMTPLPLPDAGAAATSASDSPSDSPSDGASTREEQAHRDEASEETSGATLGSLHLGYWRNAPLFRSRGGGHDAAGAGRSGGGALSRAQVFRIVAQAARRAGITRNVSPHWLRHAHASHALDRGAPISLVKDTLGHANISTTNDYVHARPGASSGDFLPV